MADVDNGSYASPVALARLERKIRKAKAQGLDNRVENLIEKLLKARAEVAAIGHKLEPSEFDAVGTEDAPKEIRGGDSPQGEDAASEGQSESKPYDYEKEVKRNATKVFVSRIPSAWEDDFLMKVFEDAFGSGSVEKASVVKPESTLDNNKGTHQKSSNGKAKKFTFGFVSFKNTESRDVALETAVLKPSDKTETKKYALRITEVGIIQEDGLKDGAVTKEEFQSALLRKVCSLWQRGICPYRQNCKFEHIGEGACAPAAGTGKSKTKCFKFKKTGTCSKGEDCPFMHDVLSSVPKHDTFVPKPKSEKPCLTFVKKGVCKKKGYGCPYSHAEDLLERRKRKLENKEKDVAKKKMRQKKDSSGQIELE